MKLYVSKFRQMQRVNERQLTLMTGNEILFQGKVREPGPPSYLEYYTIAFSSAELNTRED
jgi:hypothetical protein